MRGRSLLLLIVAIALGACWPFGGEDELAKSKRLVSENKAVEALTVLSRVIRSDREGKDSLEAARMGAKLSFLELKDYQQALFFFRHLVLYSGDSSERLESQKKIAEIYFERISEHDKAVIEFNKILQVPVSKEDEVTIRINLAKSLFYLNRFGQAELEINIVLDEATDQSKIFEAKVVKANIFFNSKQLEKSIILFKELMEKDPDRARDEQVGVQLAIAFEELSRFGEAIDVLRTIRNAYPNPQFIDTKIERLRQRQELLPGAKGLKK